VNGIYQFGITDPRGVTIVLQACDDATQILPPPNDEYFLMTFFGFVVFGLCFLGKITKRIGT
jgi:nucleoid-associated protein YgaU